PNSWTAGGWLNFTNFCQPCPLAVLYSQLQSISQVTLLWWLATTEFIASALLYSFALRRNSLTLFFTFSNTRVARYALQGLLPRPRPRIPLRAVCGRLFKTCPPFPRIAREAHHQPRRQRHQDAETIRRAHSAYAYAYEETSQRSCQPSRRRNHSRPQCSCCSSRPWNRPRKRFRQPEIGQHYKLRKWWNQFDDRLCKWWNRLDNRLFKRWNRLDDKLYSRWKRRSSDWPRCGWNYLCVEGCHHSSRRSGGYRRKHTSWWLAHRRRTSRRERSRSLH
ncbi:hypothetical protein BDN70DRAFT_917310, partial [Pholiota conissans]